MASLLDSPDLPQPLQDALQSHLPSSLPLLRRLQFMNFPGGKTPTTHILHIFENPQAFTIAYVDLSLDPGTEVWIYSSLELVNSSPSPELCSTCTSQILTLLRRIAQLEKMFTTPRNNPGNVIFGCVHPKVLQIFKDFGIVNNHTPPHQKYIFKLDELPVAKALYDEEIIWSQIKKSDLPLVLSRTYSYRTEKTMVLLPSVALLLNNTPISWAFLGPDASLTTLHCEEPYRGNGLAKAVALKIMRNSTAKYGPEPFSHADVLLDNVSSKRVCESLGGIPEWIDYWVRVNIQSVLGA